MGGLEPLLLQWLGAGKRASNGMGLVVLDTRRDRDRARDHDHDQDHDHDRDQDHDHDRTTTTTTTTTTTATRPRPRPDTTTTTTTTGGITPRASARQRHVLGIREVAWHALSGARAAEGCSQLVGRDNDVHGDLPASVFVRRCHGQSASVSLSALTLPSGSGACGRFTRRAFEIGASRPE